MNSLENVASSQELFQSVKYEGINAAQLLAKDKKNLQKIDEKEKSPREKKKERAKLQLEKVGTTSEQKTENLAKSMDYLNRIPPYLYPEGFVQYIQSAMAIFSPLNLRADKELAKSTKADILTQKKNTQLMQDLKNALTRKLGKDETEGERKIEIERILTISSNTETIDDEMKTVDPSKIDAFPADEDCRRFYLGLPQKHNTLGISEYQPTKAENKDTYYYTFNDFDKQALVDDYFLIIKKGYLKDKLWNQVDGQEDAYHIKYSHPYFQDKSKVFDPLHEFTITLGKDEKGVYISYYDIYDLDGHDRMLNGKPYEFYDRIYYDPKTKKVIK